MRIAILGTRGIPANYGGFETFAEELSVRLVARGHEVTVYCRERFPLPKYRGVDLVYLPTIRSKYFDTLAHTFVSTLHLLRHPADVALYCNGANAIFTLLPRIAGIPAAINVDGIERQRRKWRLHPREHGVTGDDPFIHCDQREQCIATGAQIVDQPGFVPPAERDLFNDADRRNIAGRFEPNYH